jgi:hypothetical protein
MIAFATLSMADCLLLTSSFTLVIFNIVFTYLIPDMCEIYALLFFFISRLHVQFSDSIIYWPLNDVM